MVVDFPFVAEAYAELSSYFERWKTHNGLLKFLDKGGSGKCDILIHMDSMEEAKEALGDK